MKSAPSHSPSAAAAASSSAPYVDTSLDSVFCCCCYNEPSRRRRSVDLVLSPARQSVGRSSQGFSGRARATPIHAHPDRRRMAHHTVMQTPSTTPTLEKWSISRQSVGRSTGRSGGGSDDGGRRRRRRRDDKQTPGWGGGGGGVGRGRRSGVFRRTKIWNSAAAPSRGT